MSQALFNYPQQAKFGRVLPKTKIYEHSGATSGLRELFVRQVDQIVWQYKLAPETINLPAKLGVSEIQVFSITLKTLELNLDVLRCIDRAILFPIVFELNFEGKTQVVAAYKRQNESDTSRLMLSDYFVSVWMPNDTKRSTMPLTLDLANLYEQILYRLIPWAPRTNEVLADFIQRIEQIKVKQKEIDKVTRRLATEKQFNRKVEINATLRQLKNAVEQLTR